MIEPSQKLENTFKIINQVFNYAGVKYWLCFGGLWGLVRNDGVIPDDDLDLCVFYSNDYKRIEKAFKMSQGRYTMIRAMVDDKNKENALYCGFESEVGYPHICLSFWFIQNGVYYYCHDQMNEVEGIGVPKSGYFFRGVPEYCIKETMMVEWPGINQMTKICVPAYPGGVLDNMYPNWAYKKQRYEIKKNVIQKDKMVSYHHGGAMSPYTVHVNSMADFNNRQLIDDQLRQSKIEWDKYLRSLK